MKSGQILRKADLLETLDATNQQVVLAPYRINPLGAHVDHQGGSVLGRAIDLYTAFAFESAENQVEVTHNQAATPLALDNQTIGQGWERYLTGAINAFRQTHRLDVGLRGTVAGSLLGAGLSSSASVLLAYLSALAAVNSVSLTKSDLVELVRQVENEQLGLNNGVQDQMCIAHGRDDALAVVDSRNRTVQYAEDPSNVDDICWLLTYSGFSRELVGSGFNSRVAECRDAARRLDANATVLGEVSAENRAKNWASLPDMLQRRAAHYFTETQRVAAGASLWSQGDWAEFGRKMNQSCHSSITQYESGSEPINKLHEIVSSTTGVYGSRFCGGGYGGCVVALVEQRSAESAAESILERYLAVYPDKENIAVTFTVQSENGVRLLS